MNNPLGNLDPTGHCSIGAIGAGGGTLAEPGGGTIAGAAIGAGTAGAAGAYYGYKAGSAVGGAIGSIVCSGGTGTGGDGGAGQKYAGKTVPEILKGKKGSIKNAPLEPGSPSWKRS